MRQRYSEEQRDAIKKRLARGEDIHALRMETGIPERTLRDWKYEVEYAASKGQPIKPPAPADPQTPPIQSSPAPENARILIYDIETLPNRGWFFDCFSPHRAIPTTFIDREKSVCSIAYKFLGDAEARVISIADFPASFSDPYDDKSVLRTFLPVWEQAHWTVAHYGDKFDRRFLAGRLLSNGLPSLAPVNQIDTYKLAKKYFNLNSNKLDYLGTILGVGNKNKTDSTLWTRCARGEIAAVKEMAAYNVQDVALLEAVFVKLLPHVQSRMNLNLLVDEPIKRCKQCGLSNLELRGYELTAASLRHRHLCVDCGSWSVFPKRQQKPSSICLTPPK